MWIYSKSELEERYGENLFLGDKGNRRSAARLGESDYVLNAEHVQLVSLAVYEQSIAVGRASDAPFDGGDGDCLKLTHILRRLPWPNKPGKDYLCLDVIEDLLSPDWKFSDLLSAWPRLNGSPETPRT